MPLHRIISINPDPAIFETAIPLSVLPAITATNRVLPGIAISVLEICIGYTKHGRHYLDKQLKGTNTEQQIRALRMYYEQRFTPYERAILRWAYCQVPVVQVGELRIVSIAQQWREHTQYLYPASGFYRVAMRTAAYHARSYSIHSRHIHFSLRACFNPNCFKKAAVCSTTLTPLTSRRKLQHETKESYALAMPSTGNF
mgnify:CR=1 FL=1